jgi:hypothetical protein
MAINYRLYIDESGDHAYRHLDDPHRRYLGLTGVLMRKSYYNPVVPNTLEALKRLFFTYDPDVPPILVRKALVDKKGSFGVLREPEINASWEQALLGFYTGLPAAIFTVVIDKKEHYERFPSSAWNPYSYSLMVLLWRVRGWLRLQGETADIMPESRGQNEDNQLLAAYLDLRANDPYYGRAADYCAAYPNERLLFRRKDQNIAGLQLADLKAAEQKLLTLQECRRVLPHPIGPFGQALNTAIESKVNRYGRYLLL